MKLKKLLKRLDKIAKKHPNSEVTVTFSGNTGLLYDLSKRSPSYLRQFNVVILDTRG